MIKCSYKDIFADKERVMFVFAHPDDTEIMAGGTVARLIQDGKEVRVVKMTAGNKGSREESISEEDLIKERKGEDAAAMKILGVSQENNIHLNFKDGEIENSMEVIEALVKQIREFKPQLVVTHNPEHVIVRFAEGESWVNHRDHRATATSTLDACYPYSRDLLFFPEHFENPKLSSHKVTEYLLIDYYDHPDTINIDVTETVQQKTDSIACHASQFSKDAAQGLTDFLCILDDTDRRYERFRHVVAD